MEFQYTAKDIRTGKRVAALMSAESQTAVISSLQLQGLLPLKITPQRKSRAGTGWSKWLKPSAGRRVKSKELTVFTRQLAAVIGAGLLLSDALETVADDLDNTYFRSVIQAVRKDITGGTNFSQALAKHKNVFSKYYISVIKTGETTGRLHVTLDDLAEFLENMERIKQKVKGAIQYPLFIFIFACLVVVSLVVFIIPKFKDIFAQSGAQLPWLTRAVIGFSDFAINHCIGIVGCLLLVVLVIRYMARLPQVSPYLDVVKLRIPLIGRQIIHKSIVSQFCRTLGFMLSAGVSLPLTLEISAQVIENSPVVKAVHTIKRRVLAGVPLTSAIREQKVFPQLVTKMSLVGEKTGQLDRMFLRTAEYYDNELESSIHALLVMLEPALIIFVGIIVGTVVISLYLPIFKLSTLIQ